MRCLNTTVSTFEFICSKTDAFKSSYNCFPQNCAHTFSVIFYLLLLLLARFIARCPRCNHIVVTIHHLIGLGAFCHSIKQVAPRVIKREHTKGVYNRIVVTIATDFTFFFFFFFFISLASLYLFLLRSVRKNRSQERIY